MKNKNGFFGLGKLKDSVKLCIEEIKDDINVIKERDPAAKSTAEVLLTYSGLHAVLAYRLSHALYTRRHYLSARVVSQSARFLTGIEIHPGAKIGKGLFIDHGSGVVIGETAELGDNCTLYQGVTLGGTGKDTGKRHPTLGNNVLCGAGAKVLGPFKVGDNSKVAANAVVLKEIPPDCTAVGIPAKVVKKGEHKVPQCDLDQIHIPDPVAQELKRLNQKIEQLERMIGCCCGEGCDDSEVFDGFEEIDVSELEMLEKSDGGEIGPESGEAESDRKEERKK